MDMHTHILVVVPCLDEEATIATVVTGIPREIEGVDRVDVMVFDDGSEDETARVASRAGAEVVRHAENMGLGKTFQEAVEIALRRKIDILVHIDGDGQFDPGHIPRLIAPIVGGRADMVTASRFADPDLVPDMPWIKRWGNRAVSRVIGFLTRRRFRDVSCGFRAFSRQAMLRLNLFGDFTYTHETFLELVFKDLPIVEIPTPVRGTREHGDSRIASSIPRYAYQTLKIIMRAFIAYRPFIFFSTIAIVFFATGFGLLGFLLAHYVKTGAFSPHLWAGFTGGSLSFMGVITLVIGFLADMLVRVRTNQERMLYLLRKDR